MKTFERICWFWCSGDAFCGDAFCGGGGWARRGWARRGWFAFSTPPPLAAPATSLSGPLWGRAGANAAAAGLGVNVAPARGWSGPQRCGAARLRAQGWRCPAARLFACAAAGQGWPDHSEVEPTNRNKLGLKSVHRGVRTCDGKRTSWAPSSPPSIRSRK